MPPKRRASTTRRSRKRPVKAEDLLNLRFVRGGTLSPDGALYVFPVESVRRDRKGYDSHLYLLRMEDASLRRFTYGKRNDVSPVFSPSGDRIAFIGKRGQHPGIHLIPTDGGEARPLIERDGAFSDLSFSPDGHSILCCFRPNDPVESEEATGSAAKGAGHAAANGKRPQPLYRHIDRLHYRADGAGFLPKAPWQVWIFDVATGEGVQITHGSRDAVQPVFSPDGRRIAFTMNVQRDPDLDIDLTDLFVVSARGGKPRRLPTPPGPASRPSFSPDGKRIAYFGHDDLEARDYENERVWVVPA